MRVLNLVVSALFPLLVQGADDSDYNLVQIVYVSRHGIRTPFAPPFGTVSNYTAYTNKIFPDNTSWGMTYEAFANQEITPHGAKILPLVGAYYMEKYLNHGLDLSSCENVVAYADNSTRDVQTGELWLDGFGCTNVPVQVVGEYELSDLIPVLSDHDDGGCAIATEAQVKGLYGGDVNSITALYAEPIEEVQTILNMPANASLCRQANVNYTGDVPCTFFETGYVWTGVYYEGMFLDPLYYAQYFAESWLFQYTSNLTDWAFGMLTLESLTDMYTMHIETLWFGTNYWNSRAYSSQQLAYIVASIDQFVTGKPVAGVDQSEDTELLLLFSHDTNILYLQRLLNLNWIPFGYASQIATTGGALSFELYTYDGDYYVRLHYDAASPNQQRNAEVLTIDNPPSVSNIMIPECGVLYCPWDTFKQVALSKVDMNCIAEPLKSSVEDIYDSSSKSNKNSNDDDKKKLSTVGAVLITIGVCVFVFLAGHGGYYMYSKKANLDVDSKRNLI